MSAVFLETHSVLTPRTAKIPALACQQLKFTLRSACVLKSSMSFLLANQQKLLGVDPYCWNLQPYLSCLWRSDPTRTSHLLLLLIFLPPHSVHRENSVQLLMLGWCSSLSVSVCLFLLLLPWYRSQVLRLINFSSIALTIEAGCLSRVSTNSLCLWVLDTQMWPNK